VRRAIFSRRRASRPCTAARRRSNGHCHGWRRLCTSRHAGADPGARCRSMARLRRRHVGGARYPEGHSAFASWRRPRRDYRPAQDGTRHRVCRSADPGDKPTGAARRHHQSNPAGARRMAVIPVELAGRSYEVRVGSGLLTDLAGQCGPLLRKKRVPIVTDNNVERHWRETADGSLAAAGFEPRWMILEPGEGAKSWTVLERLMDWLLAEEVERGDHVLALGGGVIGDLTGFAAAILKRGC